MKLLKHKVKKGDNLSKIAISHGLKNWRALYDAPENVELRKKRADPNKIMPGDIVNIPLGRLSPEDAKKFDAAIAALEGSILAKCNLSDNLGSLIVSEIKTMKETIRKMDKYHKAVDVLGLFVSVGGSIGAVAKASKAMSGASAANIVKLNRKSLLEVNKMMSQPIQKAIFGVAKKKELESPPSVSSLNTWINALGHGFSLSLYDKVATNLMLGNIPQELKGGNLKAASLTFFEAFGKDPQVIIKSNTAKLIQVWSAQQKSFQKSIDEDMARLKKLKALRSSYR